MKVLWLCANPGRFHCKKSKGEGWVGALQEEILNKHTDLQLVCLFSYNKKLPKEIEGNITYYPIYRSRRNKIKTLFRYSEKNKEYQKKITDIIKDEKPDIIEVWGTELGHGLIVEQTSIPVVVHIQGLLNPILDAYFPPGYNLWSILKAEKFNIWGFYWKYYRIYKLFKYDAIREKRILRSAKYILGRTEWDKTVTHFLAPDAIYFYCAEALRSSFYDSNKWEWKYRKELIVTSVINDATYKGVDVILRTAKLLKELYGNNFRWNVYGINNAIIHERIIGIKASKVNVHCCGRVSAEIIAEKLLDSDVFCHESYIENSPNCVCEAQYLGVPVVSSLAGGTDTIMKDHAGIIVPTNDPYRSAAAIIHLKEDRAFAENISQKEIAVSKHRHSNVLDQVIKIYTDILNSQ